MNTKEGKFTFKAAFNSNAAIVLVVAVSDIADDLLGSKMVNILGMVQPINQPLSKQHCFPLMM